MNFPAKLFRVVAGLSVAGMLATVATAEASEFYPSERYPDYPFSEAVASGGILYLSGDLGVNAEGELVSGGIVPEATQVMENIKATLARRQLSMTDIVKCTVFLADMGEWAEFNTVYAGYFEPGRYPARSAMGASALALGARVEVECMAGINAD